MCRPLVVVLLPVAVAAVLLGEFFACRFVGTNFAHLCPSHELEALVAGTMLPMFAVYLVGVAAGRASARKSASVDDLRVLTLATTHDMVIRGVAQLSTPQSRRAGCCGGGGGGSGCRRQSGSNSNRNVTIGCCSTRARQVIVHGKLAVVDGVAYDRDPKANQLVVEISNGVRGPVSAYASRVQVAGVAESMYASGDSSVECGGDVGGNVDIRSGNFRCAGSVRGSAQTRSGNLECGDIGGNVSVSSGNVRCRGCIRGDAHARSGTVSSAAARGACVRHSD